MAPCERPNTINGSQMDRWLGLSAEHDPTFPELTLAPNSKQRLYEALGRLERAPDMTGVSGRRALKDVLGCFEPISALFTPPDKHTGGDTLYAQVAAAYEAYRAGNLDQDAMDAVEAFTEQILFAIAGNTQPPDSSVSSLTYENEFFSGEINATRYETDALGQQALQTLDHVQTLFTTHRDSLPAQHNDQRQSIQARRALPANVIGALTAIELVLAGCTGGISPTVSPTTEATKPAITAPLPTAEHTKTPTLTPTPTEAPTPTAVAKPDTSSNYPGAVSDRLLTDTRLQEHKTAFATLVKSNSDVASEAHTMETRLKLICGNTCTTEGVLDQARWGIIARNSEGAPLVLQKTTDGGKTWVNVVDASAYSELVANAKFDKANYKLTQLQRPSGIPEDATGEVMTQNNWMVYVWRDKTTGKILAWYDAANDQYLTVDGKKLEAELVYTPFEPGKTTWEDCQKNKIPWLSEDKKELVRKLKQFHQFDLSSSEISTGIIESFVPLFNEPYTFADKVWYISELYYNISSPKVQIPICGTLQNPHGDIMPVYALPVTFQLPDGTYYPTTIAVAMDMNFVKKLAQDNYGDDPERIEGVLLRASPENKLQGFSNLNSIHIGFLTSEQPLTAGTIPESEAFATLYNYNLDNGYAQILLKALQGQATKEEIDLLIDTILPVFRININL